MLIKDMFQKKIDRDIQGVVIAGQSEETNVSQELEEYVVTKELQKHFADFFSAYKKGIGGTTMKTGVWISGFFGSGKSHLLKILSYLLENRMVGDKHALDYFIDDKKIDDPMILADMQLAASVSTDVILFDIASKSESNSRQNKDAIVNVFLKVFNEMQGFCGSIPRLADLEQNLFDKGRYDEFKQAFENEYGSSWIESRQDFDFIQDTVVAVLTDMNYMSEDAAKNYCEKAGEPLSISPEDFANRVKKYIDKKENNHHVVFLADEMGQYIGDDSQLMLGLQTVQEDLARECNGKAWVIVTSQQDIDSITNVKGYDFSKIQGRFDTRLSLSSANVDEVIKKRILEKTDTAAQTLRLYYDQNATIIKNLIVFNDSVEKKLYSSGQDFSEVYPFVPYQFKLLGSVLTSIRIHSSSGKDLSEGERSMLARFKDSAVQVMNEETGTIVPFYMFYDSLENLLDHSYRDVIIGAYDNTYINPNGFDHDVFAINVLKTLFMIKYVIEIEANIENITSLMVDNIDQDRIELKKHVEDALKALTGQMLVQKNGNLYVFLTDEEQEVNREIDNQNVEIGEVIAKALGMIFEDIFKDKKYRYPKLGGRYVFSFNQVVDDRPYKANKKYDIGLRILTPWYDGARDDTTLRMISGQGHEVVVALPNDDSFLNELRVFLQIEKYLQLNTAHLSSTYEAIKDAKQSERRDRNNNAKVYLTESLKEADLYVNGDLLKPQAKDATGRINEALGKLTQTVYHKLDYIDTPMSETDVRKIFEPSNQGTLDLEGKDEPNVHALDDVLAFVTDNSKMHMKTSMKTVKDHFMKAPYGFVADDVHWLVARLFKRGDLMFTVNGSSVTLLNKSADDIVNYIIKKDYVEKLLMEERVRVSEKDKKAVRDVMKEVFRVSSIEDDEDAMMENFQRYSENLIHEMEHFEPEYQYNPYPGKQVLEDGKKLFQDVLQIQTPFEFFQIISDQRDDFFDFMEAYEPIEAFFGGEQKGIFTRTIDMLKTYDESKTYIVDDELETVAGQMQEIVQEDSPYSDISKLPELQQKFTDFYSKILDDELGPVIESIDQAKTRVFDELVGKEYEADKSEQYSHLFMEIRDRAEQCKNIARLKGYVTEVDALKIRLLNEMTAMDDQIVKQKSEENSHTKPGSEIKHKTTKNVSAKQLTGTSSWRLEKPEDIDDYTEDLRDKLRSQLDEDTIINVEF